MARMSRSNHDTKAARTRRLRSAFRGASLVPLASAALLVPMALFAPSLSTAAAVASAPTAIAPGAPGAPSFFDLARKDCVGTARNTTSKVWFTIADGVLSDVSYPTIDNTNVKTLQYIVTDGATFTDLQERDMVSTATALDAGGMVCRVTSKAKSGAYQLVTDYITDPARNSVLMSTTLTPAWAGSYRVYVRFDATVNGNGGGAPGNGGPDNAVTDTTTGHPIAVSSDTNTTTNAVNRDYAQPVFAAL